VADWEHLPELALDQNSAEGATTASKSEKEKEKGGQRIPRGDQEAGVRIVRGGGGSPGVVAYCAAPDQSQKRAKAQRRHRLTVLS